MATPAGRWDFARWGPPGLEAVRALHQPAERFRVSLYRYPAGADFGGAARADRWYVLAGACTITVGTSSWTLAAGDIADLPSGEYRLCVSGSESVELVAVWELPTILPPTDDA
jgi:quercetin dioxygenase-like cupin family protein